MDSKGSMLFNIVQNDNSTEMVLEGGPETIQIRKTTCYLKVLQFSEVMPSQFILINPIPVQQAPTILVPTITYPRYEPPRSTFFEQKATTSIEVENNFASEIGQMKKTMSQITIKLTHLKLSQANNNNCQGMNAHPYNTNNYGQSYNKNFIKNNNVGNNFNPLDHNNWFQR